MGIEPKVQVPYVNPPDGIPRRIVVERQRRLFERQDIEQLLLAEGINYGDPSQNRSYLPLEAFDNSDFDERTPQEWIAFAREGGRSHHVPAKGLFFDDDGRGHWRDCKVIDFNESEHRFIVSTDLSPDPIRIAKVYLMFKSEDPFRFAKRVAAAHKARRIAESMIKYTLYIDNMPTDEIAPLSSDRMQRIKWLALNSSQKLIEAESYLPIEPLQREVFQNYARSANKIIFDIASQDPTQRELFAGLDLPPEPEKSPVPQLAHFPVPYENNHAFNKMKQRFEFSTYLGEQHIIDALLQVQESLLIREELRVFQLPIDKAISLEEFGQMQNQSIDRALSTLQTSWLKNIQESIRDNLKHIGKGWLNMNEPSRDIYEMSKLKRFMTTVRFMMEDAVRIIMTTSIDEFVQFFVDKCSFDAEIRGPSDVTISFRQILNEEIPKPIFSVEIIFKDIDFSYNIELSDFKSKMLQLFERIIYDFHTIPQIEPMVMDKYFWTEVKHLSTIHPNETIYANWKESLEKSLLHALEPLREYLKAYDKYREIMAIDISKYIESLKATGKGNEHDNDDEEEMEHSLEDFRKEIQKWFNLRNEIIRTVPPSVNLGIFVIDCQKICISLSDKCNELGHVILDHVLGLAKTKSSKVRESFSKLSRDINRPPATIEQLTELRERMEQVPKTSLEIEQDILQMKELYELLDAFQFDLPEDDFCNKITSMGWPKKISEQLITNDSYLNKKKDQFREKLLQDQEVFEKEIDATEQRVNQFSKHTDIKQIQNIAKEVKLLQQDIRAHQTKTKDFNNKEILFAMEVTEYSRLKQIVRHFTPFAELWITAADWQNWQDSWINDPFETLDASKINDDVRNAERTMVKCLNQFKEMPTVAAVAKATLDKIQDFKPNMPLLLALRNPGMRPRHWERVSNSLNIKLSVGEEGTIRNLQDVFDLNLLDHLEQINAISDVASKEFTIEKALTDMKAAWTTANFEVISYRNTGTYVIKIPEETQQQLDDHIALTQTIGFSAFKKEFEDEIIAWDNLLILISEVLEAIIENQRDWMGLEPVLSAPEIIKQLPQLHQTFKTVDTKWRKIMEGCHRNPNIMNFVSSTKNILRDLENNSALLSSIQKGLNHYLETKRKQFARLYFLADDELLKILAEAREPRAVQPYLKKCFESIESIRFEDNDDMTCMISKEAEEIEFSDPVQPKGGVESWLKEVEGMMCSSVHRVVHEAIIDYTQSPRKEWVLKWPAQVIIVVSQIFWTRGVTEALESKGNQGLVEYLEVVKEQLIDLTQIVSGDIDRLSRSKLSALITIEVHARDVIDQMIKENVGSVHDFEWVSQMRYYWEDNDVKVRQVEASFIYGYEYLGCTSRLVITPLTDRIYLTLTGALHLNLGGAPAGPAGTGKTETVKDLAKALAKQVCHYSFSIPFCKMLYSTYIFCLPLHLC